MVGGVQDGIDLPHKLHSDVDGGLCHGATKLSPGLLVFWQLFCRSYLEIIWHIIVARARFTKKGIAVGSACARFVLVGGWRLGVS